MPLFGPFSRPQFFPLAHRIGVSIAILKLPGIAQQLVTNLTFDDALMRDHLLGFDTLVRLYRYRHNLVN